MNDYHFYYVKIYQEVKQNFADHFNLALVFSILEI